MSRRWLVLCCATVGATPLTACDKLFDIDRLPAVDDAHTTGDGAPRPDGHIADIGAPGDAIAPCFGPRVLVPGINDGLDPQMRSDRLEIIYARSNNSAYDLFHGTRSSTQAAFVETELDTLNTSGEETDPAITDDGLLIVFKSNRNGNGQRVFQAARPSTSSPFAAIALVRGLENFPASGIDLSPDGNTIYLDNGSALFVAHRTSQSADFDTPVALTGTHVDYPSVTPNGLEVFSNGPGGFVRSTRATNSDTDLFTGSDVIDAGANDGDVLPNNSAIVIVGGSAFYTLERCN